MDHYFPSPLHGHVTALCVSKQEAVTHTLTIYNEASYSTANQTLTTMTGVIQLLLVLALIHGGALAAAHRQDCDAGKIDVKGDEALQITDDIHEGSYGNLVLYVKTKTDFKGLTVNAVAGNDTAYSGWFQKTSECFPSVEKWHQLIVFASVYKDEKHLKLGFKAGNCNEQCETNISVERIRKLGVWIHGDSELLLNRPPSRCGVTKVNSAINPDPWLPQCSPSTPPRRSTSNRPTTKSQPNGFFTPTTTIIHQ